MGEQSARFTHMLEQQKQQAEAAQALMRQQLEAMQQQMQQQAEQWNKANQKAPDSAALRGRNLQEGKGGQGSTLLTGPAGVDKDRLLLGRAALLGA